MPRPTLHIRLLCAAVLTAAAFGGGAGCSGPTKAGLEARADARDRMGLLNSQISYDQAKRSFDVGQLDRAMREVSAAIDRSPRQPNYHMLRGRISLEQHRLEHAMDSFTLAIELAEPAYEKYLELLAKDEAAATASQKAVPEEIAVLARAHYFAAIIHQRWSNHEDALEHYTAASEVDQTQAPYVLAAAETLIAMGRYDEAEAFLQPRLTQFAYNPAIRHLLSQVALLKNDMQLAVRLLEQARLLDPEDAMLVEELARAQFAAGLYGKCHRTLRDLHAMRRGERADPSLRPDLIQLEARCMVMLDRPIDARPLYIKLTDLTPEDVQAWIELGTVALDIGDQRRLSTAGSRVIALAPERWEGYYLQAMFVRSEAAPDSSMRAARLLREAANRARRSDARNATSTNDALPHILVGRALEEHGDVSGAIEAYAHAVRIDPQNREAHALLTSISRSQRMNGVYVE